ncbi:hypothetical protein HYH03_011903 [Edaphochlamys debaryana]|uniref:Peptidase M11 gametolysin domain-containing protein n=1 Tax=Edaphochlamys debaryana TaxID=47281 RepID=A0A836BW14_9CHLO|nr:hypothetical protein HYH03_011903 [Edaphochlamys debaryana]|eukprot:KAG2489624.1 hypothetical protein HYH03_011903 [Edaphochlamys debaryana]
MGHKYGEDAEVEEATWTLHTTDAGLPTVLDFGDEVPELMTGDEVVLSVEVPASAVQGPASAGRRRLSDLQLVPGVPLKVAGTQRTSIALSKDFIVGGKPVNLTTAIFSFSFCGRNPDVTPEQLRAVFYNSASADPTRTPTMERMFSTCTFNKLLMPEALTTILPLETIPCGGSHLDDNIGRTTINFDFANKCDFPEIDTMRYYAKQLANGKYASRLPGGWNGIKRIVMLVPNMEQCPWAGLGSTGCSPGVPCTSWMQGSVDLPVMFQELMHNTGLYHSERLPPSLQSIPYGDNADPMGSPFFDNSIANGMVCTNAAQAWKAGWASAIELNITSLIPGTPLTRAVPALGFSSGSGAMLRIRLFEDGIRSDGKPIRQRALYVSYRSRMPVPGFDSGLHPTFNMRGAVHQFDGVSVPRADPWITPAYLLALLDTNATVSELTSVSGGREAPIPVGATFLYYPGAYVDPVAKADLSQLAWGLGFLNITMISKTGTGALFSLCRALDTTESGSYCVDGIDNDCDGLADENDPDCADEFEKGEYSDPPPGTKRPPPRPPLPRPPRPAPLSPPPGRKSPPPRSPSPRPPSPAPPKPPSPGKKSPPPRSPPPRPPSPAPPKPSPPPPPTVRRPPPPSPSPTSPSPIPEPVKKKKRPPPASERRQG